MLGLQSILYLKYQGYKVTTYDLTASDVGFVLVMLSFGLGALFFAGAIHNLKLSKN